MRRLAAALLLAAVPLAACATTPAPTAASPAAQPVALDRTGGIAGLRESVRVDAQGRWQHVAGTGRTTGRLSADQRAELARMAADPALAVEARQPRDLNLCADGYEVGLTVGPTTVRWQECGRGDSGPPLAAQIARLLDRSIS